MCPEDVRLVCCSPDLRAVTSRLEPKNLNLKLFLDSTIHGGKRGIWTVKKTGAHKISSLHDKSLLTL